MWRRLLRHKYSTTEEKKTDVMEIDRGNENLRSYICVCATHMIATSDIVLIKYSEHSSTTSCHQHHRPAGSWSKKQEDCLKELIRSNTVDYKNWTPDYLFDITEQYIRTCKKVDNGAYFNGLPMPPRLDHIYTIYVDYLRTYFSKSTYLIFLNNLT